MEFGAFVIANTINHNISTYLGLQLYLTTFHCIQQQKIRFGCPQESTVGPPLFPTVKIRNVANIYLHSTNGKPSSDVKSAAPLSTIHLINENIHFIFSNTEDPLCNQKCILCAAAVAFTEWIANLVYVLDVRGPYLPRFHRTR